MKKLLILYPTQLFENIKKDIDCIIIWEHPYFFERLSYHKIKLAYHRATIDEYFSELVISEKEWIKIDEKNQKEIIKRLIIRWKITEIEMYDPIEKELGVELKNITYLNSPMFLGHDMNFTNHNSFYKYQRIKYDLLVSESGKPKEGVWSFDKENRESFGKIEKIKNEIIEFENNKREKCIKNAIKFVETNYPNNYGTCEYDDFFYPINHKESKEWFNNFLRNKLEYFGKYEDSLSLKIKIGYHSVLSPLLNIGLLTPEYIIKEIKKISGKYKISSEEGFIRQIIGWREYCYVMYNYNDKKLRISTYITKNKNKIPQCFWEGKTGMIYIDNILQNIIKTGYCHHIERLMCVGCFMIYIGISSKEILKWFQTMFIDAYDVFMIPNVYGMLLYGEIGEKKHMMSRPYFCSSNYLLKMSDYRVIKNNDIEIKGKNIKWTEIIDCLYYNHIDRYKLVFAKVYSTASAVKVWERKNEDDKKMIKKIAKEYIKNIIEK
uniref:Cryptochrome/DNA photolyase FAD-binding domain-containing protein n=1 Tax=viral metagenome TaxID=1070528 RepID=A0A6C0H5G3_9ZZZZ